MIGPEFLAVPDAATRGDEDAFGRLWRDLQPRLLRYFMVAAPAAAEDLASETWLAVVRGLNRFQGNESAFRAWLFTIARHEVLDRRRRAARRPTEDLPVTDLTGLAAPDDPPPPPWKGSPPGPRWQWSPRSPPIRPRPPGPAWRPGWTST